MSDKAAYPLLFKADRKSAARGLVAVIFLLLYSATGYGKDIFIAQTTVGTDSGVDCASAHSAVFFNSSSNWGAGPNQIGAGDTVHLCSTFTSVLDVKGSGKAGNPITILFESRALMSAPFWPTTGALSVSSKDFITIDGGKDGTIKATANGTTFVNQVNSYGVVMDKCSNCEISNLNVLNMYVRTPLSSDTNPFGVGINVSGGDDVLVHNNTISDAFLGIYQVYPGGTSSSRVSNYGNTITRCSTGVVFGSGDVNATADNIQIYNNDISDGFVWEGTWTPPPGDGHHHDDGIHVWAVHVGSAITNLKVYGNYIHGDWGAHASGWIFVEGLISNHLVYNNLLTTANKSIPAAAFIYLKGPGSGAKAYNNTIVGPGNGTAFDFDSSEIGGEIKNNIIVSVGSALYAPTGSTLAASDYNEWFNLGQNQFYYQTGFSTFVQWQGLGFDTQSLTSDPKLGAGLSLLKGSPAVGSGTNLSPFFTTDKAGVLRSKAGPWILGAFATSFGIDAPLSMQILAVH